MEGSKAALVEMLFSFGVVLALLVWQLVSLRKYRKHDDEVNRRRNQSAQERDPPVGAHSVGDR